MEELFELAAVIVVAVIGILSKAAKGKKKKEARSGSAWDELGEKIGSGIEKVIEIMEEDDGDRIKINIPAISPKPAAVSVEAAQPIVAPTVVAAQAVMQATEPDYEGGTPAEGDCDHPLHEPVEMSLPSVAVKLPDESPAMQLEKVSVHRSGVFSGKVTAAQLRQAVVMNEVLGRPVALRGAARR